MNTPLAYGNWPSPVTPDFLIAQNLRLSEPQAYGDDVFWLESRPSEKGRNALVQLSASGERIDVLPAPHSIRTSVHEYGGGSYLVTAEYIFCVLNVDQRIHIIDRKTNNITALSPLDMAHPDRWRYADFYWDAQRQHLLCVREDHILVNRQLGIEERSEIIAINLNGDVTVLISGADFYSNPRMNLTGTKLSYLCWNHPQMPWDGSECYCADLSPSGAILKTQLIAGSAQESIFQPQWSPSGDLFFVSDRNNWWNIYRFDFATATAEIMHAMEADFAMPQWVFAMSSYGFLNATNICCCYNQQGQWQLGLINTLEKKFQPINTDFKDISNIYCRDNNAYFLAASATQVTALFNMHEGKLTQLSPSPDHTLTLDDISQPHKLCFPTTDGEHAYGFYYPPKNKHHIAQKDSLPPLLVICHGGPTGATETSLNIKIQFWTSRGFAVLDVNYRGSTGYGRHYRDRLKNNWGITDVIDVCSGANYVAKQGLVDKNKMAIRGSSAGGYTVLAALTFSDTFKAGASLYGIGDLEALAKDTHKFEAHYLDNLIGKYPEQRDIYIDRSPINHIEKLNCPVIFLQGLKDKVVPPQQADAMVAALQQKGIYTAHITFSEEGHGFRQAENIKQAMQAELDFYRYVFAVNTL